MEEELCRLNFRVPERIRELLVDVCKRTGESYTGAVIRMVAEESARVRGEGLPSQEKQTRYGGRKQYLKCYTRDGSYVRYEAQENEDGEKFVGDATRDVITYRVGDTEMEWWFPTRAAYVNDHPYHYDFMLLDVQDILSEVKIYPAARYLPPYTAPARIQQGGSDV